jgi:hypothetical protein
MYVIAELVSLIVASIIAGNLWGFWTGAFVLCVLYFLWKPRTA